MSCVVVIGVVSLAPDSPASAACKTDHSVDSSNGTYVTRVTCDRSTRIEEPSSGHVPDGPSHLEPRLRADDQLGACLHPVRVAGPPDPHANDLGILDSLLAVVPPCPAAELGPIRAVTLAGEFWARTPMPRPSPSTSPAEPITGREAYLLVGTSLRRQVTQPTPLGRLTITAIGQASVDWGDGATTTAAVGDAGGPHPTGRIRHVFERRGPAPVKVTVIWRATWSLAGESGNLPRLRTAGTTTLSVREVQAVMTG